MYLVIDNGSRKHVVIRSSHQSALCGSIYDQNLSRFAGEPTCKHCIRYINGTRRIDLSLQEDALKA